MPLISETSLQDIQHSMAVPLIGQYVGLILLQPHAAPKKNPHARTLDLPRVRSPMKSYQGMPTVQFDVRVCRLCIEKGSSEPTSKGNNPNNFKFIAVKRDSPTVIRAYRIIVLWRTSYYTHCGDHFSTSGKLFNLAVSNPTPRAFRGTGKNTRVATVDSSNFAIG